MRIRNEGQRYKDYLLDKEDCISGVQTSGLSTLALALLNHHVPASALFSATARSSCFTPLNTD